MSDLNDRELSAFAFKEAITRERQFLIKIKYFYKITRDNNLKHLLAGMASSCQSRVNILQKEMKNLNIN